MEDTLWSILKIPLDIVDIPTSILQRQFSEAPHSVSHGTITEWSVKFLEFQLIRDEPFAGHVILQKDNGSGRYTYP